jgi:hypothetical protein
MNDVSDVTEVRRLLKAKLADVEEQLTAMVKPPTGQGNISFGKRVGDGTQMAVDRLTQVAVHDRLQVVRDDTAAPSRSSTRALTAVATCATGRSLPRGSRRCRGR